jgi:small conductance mechanosensitive channel
MPYSESFAKVKSLILAELVKNEMVLDTPAPEVGIINYDSHYIEVAVWPYVDPENYWDAQFEVYAQIKKAFHENDVKMAYSEGVELGAIGS